MARAFAHLNLRYNPFGELEAAERARVAVVDCTPLRTALSTPGTALQLVAPCGHGKSTHLLALAASLPEARHLRLWNDAPVPSPEPVDVLLLDEADAVWPWQRWSLLRSARSVAVGVHKSHAFELRSLGFRVVTHHVACRTLEQVQAIVDRRIDAARLSPGSTPGVTRDALTQLHQTHGGNLRAIESDLYGAFQRLKEIKDVSL